MRGRAANNVGASRPESLRSFLEASAGRLREAAWPIVQAAVVAGIAWFLAHAVLGHPQPFFAPIAAVVALAAGVGGRGTQALHMLLGVGVGVVVGELLVLVIGMGALEVTLAAAAAMLAVATVSAQPLPLIQAGASAILIVTLQSPETGGERAVDALVGGGVALLVSQALLSPSPVANLKDAGREVLDSLAGGLRASAGALASGDVASAGDALERLRVEQRSAISGLDSARETSGKIVRRTLRGRREAERLGRLDARFGDLDLLSVNVLSLARASYRLLCEGVVAPEWLLPAMRELARAVEALSEDPESPDAGRRAGEAAAGAAREAARGENRGPSDPRVALAAEGLCLAAVDVARLATLEEFEPTA